jgi:hypothetical protein
MTYHKDTWPKWRRGGRYLTDEELAVIYDGKRTGRKIKDVACQLQCSSRTVELHYAKLGDSRRGQKRRVIPAKRNLYVSTFVPQ